MTDDDHPCDGPSHYRDTHHRDRRVPEPVPPSAAVAAHPTPLPLVTGREPPPPPCTWRPEPLPGRYFWPAFCAFWNVAELGLRPAPLPGPRIAIPPLPDDGSGMLTPWARMHCANCSNCACR